MSDIAPLYGVSTLLGATWLFWLALYIGPCFLVANAAGSRGQSGWAAFFIALFFTPLLGFLWVLAKGDNVLELSKQRLLAGIDRECPHCKEQIKREATVCRFCGRDIDHGSAEAIKVLHS